jgi:hypothetical protein
VRDRRTEGGKEDKQINFLVYLYQLCDLGLCGLNLPDVWLFSSAKWGRWKLLTQDVFLKDWNDTDKAPLGGVW